MFIIKAIDSLSDDGAVRNGDSSARPTGIECGR